MWKWKRRKNITVECNGLIESKKRMREFERKYGALSIDVISGRVNESLFENNDQYLWEAYVRTYVTCGGILE